MDVDDKGYHKVTLFNNGKRHYWKVHRLVAIAFVANTDGKPHINHIDGNKLNNCPDNLEWVTSAENNRHAADTGLQCSQKRERNANCKLTEQQVAEIRFLREKGILLKEIASQYGITFQNVWRICKLKNWKLSD